MFMYIIAPNKFVSYHQINQYICVKWERRKGIKCNTW